MALILRHVIAPLASLRAGGGSDRHKRDMLPEQFFDGWALIGARPLKGQATAGYRQIPKDYGDWLAMRRAGTGR